MPAIKGTSSVSDLRARRKALKGTRFPDNFAQAVELEKVNKQVLTQWIEHRVTSILGFEDEIVSSMAINLFLPEEGESPDPKRAQLDLVGFLGEEESASFARDLWTLMLEAQENATGIPKTLLEEKKKELAAKKAESRAAQGEGRRDPDMNRYLQEANRRANAARGAMGGVHGRRHDQPSVPVSPPRYERQSSENRNGRRQHQPDERRLPPAHRRPGDNPPHPGHQHPGRYDRDGPRMPPGLPYGFDRRHERHMSRSFSPDRDRDRTRWGREEGRKDDDRGRRNERPRFYDEEDEMRFLERRLGSLRREYSNRPNDYALGDEIDDINDRLHELDRRMRRYRRGRDEDDYRRRGGRNSPRHRSRSRTPEIRRRRSRSRSLSSESRSRRRRRSRSLSSESRRSHSSVSRSSRSHSRERGRRRVERRYSSESRSSRHSD
ncbi:unnamed protein product [Cylindrotheca closterium]|uniref:PWI domain-containing protein n=1 Tax=Cylindrotheca closterium TaxID=2856 RepID=A0AAD2CN34_9STRA|nr:unnamed protein product [Cylindrotheca closterium]